MDHGWQVFPVLSTEHFIHIRSSSAMERGVLDATEKILHTFRVAPGTTAFPQTLPVGLYFLRQKHTPYVRKWLVE